MFAALGYVSALLVAHYLLPEGWLPYCALAFALSGAAVFFIRRTAAKALALSFLAAAVGFFVEREETENDWVALLVRREA